MKGPRKGLKPYLSVPNLKRYPAENTEWSSKKRTIFKRRAANTPTGDCYLKGAEHLVLRFDNRCCPGQSINSQYHQYYLGARCV